MFTDYGMKDNESNFVIIDKKGLIRYRAAGKIEEEETRKIIEILQNLLNESQPNGDKKEYSTKFSILNFLLYYSRQANPVISLSNNARKIRN